MKNSFREMFASLARKSREIYHKPLIRKIQIYETENKYKTEKWTVYHIIPLDTNLSTYFQITSPIGEVICFDQILTLCDTLIKVSYKNTWLYFYPTYSSRFSEQVKAQIKSIEIGPPP